MGLTPVDPHDLLTPSFRMPYACLTRIDGCGANLRDEALLGHKSLATTARYTHVDSERLRTLVGNLRRHS